MKIVSHFKTEQDVERYLQAVEDYTDWVWCNVDKPTADKKNWGEYFEEYQNIGGFYIDFKNLFLYGSINNSGKGQEIIHFEDAILELKKQSMKEGDLVYVSDESEEEALQDKSKRILLRKCSDGVVCIESIWEKDYKEGKTFNTEIWKYAVPVPKKKKVTLELTNEQLEKIKELINQNINYGKYYI